MDSIAVDLLDNDLLDACLVADDTFHIQHALSRNNSAISNASTAICRTVGRVVRAFCRPHMLMVELMYPDELSGWVYRQEIGGPSVHRWEYGDGILLTSRHSTCTKGMIAREACRNCNMKAVWRRECLEPCNAFYVDCLQHGAMQVVRTLALSVTSATSEEILQYTTFAPKLSAMRTRVLDTVDKVTRNFRSLENLRLSLCKVDDGVDDGYAHDAPLEPTEPVQTTVLVPSPKRPICSSMHLTVASLYEEVIVSLLGVSPAQKTFVSLDRFCSLVARYSSGFMEHSMLVRSDALDALAKKLSVPNNMLLFLKAVFFGWLRTLCDAHNTLSLAELHVGFYVAPTALFYRDIFNDSLLPAVISQSNHLMFSDYGTALAQCKHGVKPVMTAFFDPHSGMAKGHNMLPLGVTLGV